jgi:hypothetical protein
MNFSIILIALHFIFRFIKALFISSSELKDCVYAVQQLFLVFAYSLVIPPAHEVESVKERVGEADWQNYC